MSYVGKSQERIIPQTAVSTRQRLQSTRDGYAFRMHVTTGLHVTLKQRFVVREPKVELVNSVEIFFSVHEIG